LLTKAESFSFAVLSNGKGKKMYLFSAILAPQAKRAVKEIKE
jgi:hypothetical protein